MNLVDVLIILFFISALVRGVELGMVRQIFSTTGLFAGLFAGVFVQGKLIQLAHTTSTKALLALGVIIAGIALGSTVGEYLGIRLKKRIEQTKVKGINAFDRAVGSVVAGVSLLLIVWLAANI